MTRVVDWLVQALDGPAQAASAPESGPAVVGRTEAGDEVVERPVSLGPMAMFGIVTEIPGRDPGTTIVFVDEGNTPHIGQSRMWVELARAWGAEGLRVLRFDLSGNGDSPARPGQMRHVIRASEAFADVAEVRRAISPDDPSNVVLLGLCSGAYQIMEDGLLSPPRGLCVINPILTFPLSPEAPGTVAVRRQVRQGTRGWVKAAATRPLRAVLRRRMGEGADRWLEAFELGRGPAAVGRRAHVPEPVWWLANQVLIENHPVDVLDRLVRSGIDTLLLIGAADLQPIALGAQRALGRLAQTPGFTLAVLPELDHAGLLIAQRQALKDRLSAHVVSHFGPAALARRSRQPLGSTTPRGRAATKRRDQGADGHSRSLN